MTVRMNALSPAPISTPSRANRTPPTGIIADQPRPQHVGLLHDRRVRAEQARDQRPAGGRSRRRRRSRRPARSGTPARRCALAVVRIAAAQRRADQRLRGDRERIQQQRDEVPQLHADLVGGQLRRAHPTGDTGGGQVRRLERRGRSTRSRLTTSCRRITAHCGAAADALAAQRDDAQARRPPTAPARSRWPTPRARARPGRPATGDAIGGQHVREHHDQHRGAGVLHAAHPAVAGQHQQDARAARGSRSAARTPRPRPPASSPPTISRISGSATSSPTPISSHADDQRQPGRLHALVHRRVPPAGAEEPGRPPGGAVLEGGADQGEQGHHGARAAPSPASGIAPRCPTTAVSTSRNSGSAASTTNADAASETIRLVDTSVGWVTGELSATASPKRSGNGGGQP